MPTKENVFRNANHTLMRKKIDEHYKAEIDASPASHVRAGAGARGGPPPRVSIDGLKPPVAEWTLRREEEEEPRVHGRDEIATSSRGGRRQRMPTTRAARRGGGGARLLELPADVLGLVLYQLPLAHDIARHAHLPHAL